jgi:hypothetical protein
LDPTSANVTVALLVVILTVAVKILNYVRRCRNIASLSGAVPYTERHNTVPSHGRRIQLSPAEEAMVSASIELHGAMRITVVMMLSGPRIERKILREALNRLSKAHPFLRSKVVKVAKGATIMEVDDTLEIPIAEEDIPGETLEEAWRQVWSKHEKVVSSLFAPIDPFHCVSFPQESLQLHSCLASVDVVTTDQAASVDSEGHQPTTALMLSCEHAISDGVSLSVLSDELLTNIGDAATGKAWEAVKQYWCPSLETACATKGILGPLRWLYRFVSFLTLPYPTGAAVFPLTDPTALPQATAATCSTRKQYADLSMAATAKLLLACHARHTTVTGAISAATCCALGRVLSGNPRVPYDPSVPICLTYFADMRHHFVPPIPLNCLCLNVSLMPPFKTLMDVVCDCVCVCVCMCVCLC